MICSSTKLSSRIKSKFNKILDEFSKVILALAHTLGLVQKESYRPQLIVRIKKKIFTFFLYQRKCFSAKLHIWEGKKWQKELGKPAYMCQPTKEHKTHTNDTIPKNTAPN